MRQRNTNQKKPRVTIFIADKAFLKMSFKCVSVSTKSKKPNQWYEKKNLNL